MAEDHRARSCACAASPDVRSKRQTDVSVPAAGTSAGIGLTGFGVEVPAANAQKGGLAAGVLEKRVIATVIKHPQPQKQEGDEETVNDGGVGEIHPGKGAILLSVQSAFWPAWIGEKAVKIFAGAALDAHGVRATPQAGGAGRTNEMSACCSLGNGPSRNINRSV